MKDIIFKQGFKGKTEFRFIVMAEKERYEEHSKQVDQFEWEMVYIENTEQYILAKA